MNFDTVLNERYLPLLQEMIRNRCVNTGEPDSGFELRSARSLRAFFKTYGIEAEILASQGERANLVVRVPGTKSGAPSLAYMGHMDVVPAAATGWTCDPFAAEIRDGCLYGRGAVDMLNMTAGMACAFAERVSRSGPLPGDFVFVACADEEHSGRLGSAWLTEKHWDKVRADYMVTELGGFFVTGGLEPTLLITVGEKGLAWMELTTKGTAGHGSMPYRADSAALKVAEAVVRISGYRGRIMMNEAYRAMTRAMSHGPWQRLLLRSGVPTLMERALGAVYRRNTGEAKFLHAAARRTFMPNVVAAGRKVNVIPDAGRIQIDGRILPGDTAEKAEAEIRRTLGPLSDEFKIEITDFFPSNISPVDTPLYRATASIVEEHYPGHGLTPLFISSVTDGRFWRMKGTVVYGFSLFDPEMTTSAYASRLHSVDERVSIASLRKTLEYFSALPERFSRETDVT